MGSNQGPPGVTFGWFFAKMGAEKHTEIQWLIPVPFFMISASPGEVRNAKSTFVASTLLLHSLWVPPGPIWQLFGNINLSPSMFDGFWAPRWFPKPGVGFRGARGRLQRRHPLIEFYIICINALS